MLRWQTADTFQYHMHGSRTGHKHISVPRHQVPSLYHPPPYDLIHLLQTPETGQKMGSHDSYSLAAMGQKMGTHDSKC